MNKKSFISIAIICLVSILITSCSKVPQAPELSDMENSSSVISDVSEASANLSDDIRSFQVQIGNIVYKLPMRYTEFLETGWEVSSTEDVEGAELKSGTDAIVLFTKGNDEAYCTVYNPDISIQPYDKCVISSIMINTFATIKDNPVFIPGGLQINVATKQEVIDMHGEPDSTNVTSSSKTYFTYKTDNVWSYVDLIFDENDILHGYKLENPVEPEDFSLSESTDIEISYEAPKRLTNDIEDRIVKFGGDLYAFPAPLSAFIENGWTVSEEDINASVQANGLYFLDIERNGTSSHVTVYNESDFACNVYDAYVRSISSTDDKSDEFEVSGGINLDLTQDELKNILKKGNYEFTTSEISGGINYHIILSGNELDNYCNVKFDDNTVAYITFSTGIE